MDCSIIRIVVINNTLIEFPLSTYQCLGNIFNLLGKETCQRQCLGCVRKLQASIKRKQERYLIEEPCLQCFILLTKNHPKEITKRKKKKNITHFIDRDQYYFLGDLSGVLGTSGNTEDCNCTVTDYKICAELSHSLGRFFLNTTNNK